MKYIKTFENIKVSSKFGIFFTDDFISDIKDYCLEISDMGYHVNIYPTIYKKLEIIRRNEVIKRKNAICIMIDNRDGDYVLSSDVEDTIQSINYYVSRNGFSLDFFGGNLQSSVISSEWKDGFDGGDGRRFFNEVKILIFRD